MGMRAVFVTIWLVIAPLGAAADVAFERLMDLLDIDAYVAITREEGLAALPATTEAMTGQGPGPALLAQIEALYDPDRMAATVRMGMKARLSDAQIARASAFWGSAAGQRIGDLELAARRAMTDPGIEDYARTRWENEAAGPVLAQVDALIGAGDLIERNVSGALNSSYRFMQGLKDGGLVTMPDEMILSQVWEQEPAFRADTTGWLGAFLLMAIGPLSEADRAAAVAFWQSETGQALNTALFAGFDALHDELHYGTGRMIALNAGSSDL